MLAAGGSVRMGFAKVTTPLAGVSPIERLARVLEGRMVAVVTSEALRAACARAMPAADVFVNDRPEGGMNASLLVANGAVEAGACLGVMLADKPFVHPQTLDRCERAFEEAPDCDVLFPVCDGERGHPVYFAPSARARLNELGTGDTLRAVRDDPHLWQVEVECDDVGVLIDLDTPAAWRAAERRLHA